MNYGEIKAQIDQWTHRSDLTAEVPQFIYNVSQRLGRRLGVMPSPLIADTDTNSILTTHPLLYLYGSLREVGIFTENVDMVQAYEMLYQAEVKELNINYRGLDWDACPSPAVMTSKEQEAIAEGFNNDQL